MRDLSGRPLRIAFFNAAYRAEESGFRAGLSVLAPPISLVALAFLAWLLIQQRRRADQKYAGLRILR